eukprot:766715-Hanusia_phi.AAC.5
MGGGSSRRTSTKDPFRERVRANVPETRGREGSEQEQGNGICGKWTKTTRGRKQSSKVGKHRAWEVYRVGGVGCSFRRGGQ